MVYKVLKITRKRNSNYNLYLEGYKDEKIEIERDTLLNSKVRRNAILKEEELFEFLEKNQKALCLNYAYRILSYSQKTKKELEMKLREKNFENSSIELALNRVEELGLFNDSIVAENLIRNEINYKKKSKRAVMNKLYMKGVDKEVIVNALEDISDDDEYENCLHFAEKKLRSLKNEEDKFKKKRKIISALNYRQFSYDIIEKVMREFEDEDLI